MMLPRRELGKTGVVTSALGFGCANLFRVPERNLRRLTLDTAYEAGIRHFDVAPMYGLGLAEGELASFLKQRRTEVTITTKFGIEPTLISKGVARIQKPVRAFLAERPAVGEELKAAGEGPRSGKFGRLLYTSPGYNRRSAKLGLERSLKALATDYIDIFLLHDPVGSLITEAPDLAEYLDEQCRVGRIRCWGVTGRAPEVSNVMDKLETATVIQFKDDIFGSCPADRLPSERAWITYGALSRAVPSLRRFLGRSPDATKSWSERLGIDFSEETSLPRILLSLALQRNPNGPVLFSTTHPEHAVGAAKALVQSRELSESQMAAISEFTAVALLASAE